MDTAFLGCPKKVVFGYILLRYKFAEEPLEKLKIYTFKLELSTFKTRVFTYELEIYIFKPSKKCLLLNRSLYYFLKWFTEDTCSISLPHVFYNVSPKSIDVCHYGVESIIRPSEYFEKNRMIRLIRNHRFHLKYLYFFKLFEIWSTSKWWSVSKNVLFVY